MDRATHESAAASVDPIPDHVLQSIVQSLRGMRYGQVTIIVQDSRVIQIDRTERKRFTGEKDA